MKTSRGRAILRLNDLKFGLFAGDLLLPGEDAEVLVEIWESVWAELKPQGILEEMIVVGILYSLLRRQMAIRVGSDYLGEQFTECDIDHFTKCDALPLSRFVDREIGRERGLMNLLKYIADCYNKFHKGINEFKKLRISAQRTALPAPLAIDAAASKDV